MAGRLSTCKTLTYNKWGLAGEPPMLKKNFKFEFKISKIYITFCKIIITF